ncbi:hypothetical protein [Pontibacter pudoricolor]|nr:hypothetical protein [Pontibacter pudoricolor]
MLALFDSRLKKTQNDKRVEKATIALTIARATHAANAKKPTK